MPKVYFATGVPASLASLRQELARELEMTVSGIGYTVGRCEIVAAREGYTLMDSVI